MSYAKLHTSLLTSSLWTEDTETRIVWITLLCLADKHGEVQASIPGLAKVAGVSLEACEKAIAKFLSPDKYSRSRVMDGRRLQEIDGGWEIVTYAKHRAMASKDDEKEKAAERQRRFRERNATVTPSNAPSRPVTENRDIADADADADANKDKNKETETETSTLQACSKDAPSRDASLSSLSKEVEEICLEWNKLAELPHCQKITPSRFKSIKARLGEPYFVANWKTALAKIKDSPFCCGDNERGWKASFDWFLKPDSCVKVMEGKYDKATSQPAKSVQSIRKQIFDLESEIKQLEGQLVHHFDRERYPHKVERLKAAQAELAQLKASHD